MIQTTATSYYTLTFENAREEWPQVLKRLLSDTLDKFKVQGSGLYVWILHDLAERRYGSWHNPVEMWSRYGVKHDNIYINNMLTLSILDLLKYRWKCERLEDASKHAATSYEQKTESLF